MASTKQDCQYVVKRMRAANSISPSEQYVEDAFVPFEWRAENFGYANSLNVFVTTPGYFGIVAPVAREFGFELDENVFADGYLADADMNPYSNVFDGKDRRNIVAHATRNGFALPDGTLPYCQPVLVWIEDEQRAETVYLTANYVVISEAGTGKHIPREHVREAYNTEYEADKR